MYEIMQRCNTN